VTLGRLLRASGLAALALAAGLSLRPAPTPGYAAMRGGDDTLRARLANSRRTELRGRIALGALVLGYLSPRGLPPVAGVLAITDTGLVFRSADGRYAAVLPVVGPLRQFPGGRWRASAVSLAYMDDELGPPSYVFRVDGGIFVTDAPGSLLDVAAHPAWLDSLRSREWGAESGLVNGADDAAVRALLGVVMNGSYADSLYAIFGKPARPAGVVGARGRAAGRLGEYVTTRDSLALDPARITSVAQLRHTLAHELAHRWQARSAGQLAVLWKGVPPIRDPKRYGYGNVSEQQAEAAAFAVHFLLATATARDSGGQAAALDHYELLVPGTRTMARYFAMQPVFSRHPLRGLLTAGPGSGEK
jgi:hypothetical protein